MRYRLLLCAACGVAGLAFGSAVFAADAPASKCVTAQTKASHAASVARMEKDILPYLKQENAAGAITNYRNALDTAWAALEEPYCGFGVYGSKSAIKSYGKSIDRSRLAFVEALVVIRNGHAVAAAPTTPEPTAVTEPTEPTATEKAEPKKVVTIKPKKTTPAVTMTGIVRGLHRGERSENVRRLQERLAAHFNLSTGDYVTGYFGSRTEGLVRRYQLEKKVIKSKDGLGAGLVGPKTVRALNADE